jgi:hypothetical protein
MARKIVILPDEMDKVIEEMSDQSGASTAEVIRRLLATGLKEQGIIVSAKVRVGGKRDGAGRPKEKRLA